MKGGEEILHIDNICKNFDLGRGKVLKACDCVDIICLLYTSDAADE